MKSSAYVNQWLTEMCVRRWVLLAYQNSDLSEREIERLFGVSLSFVRDLLRLYRETGHVDPKPHAGGTPRSIDGATLADSAQMRGSTSGCNLGGVTRGLPDPDQSERERLNDRSEPAADGVYAQEEIRTPLEVYAEPPPARCQCGLRNAGGYVP